jgi:hypothetical protein
MQQEPAPSRLSSVDLALLRSARAWGGEDASGLWDRFPADRRASLGSGWESGRAGDRESALDRLRREHAAQARPDLSRVHVSWWVRALKDEPLAVRRAVAANLPPALAGALRDGLALPPDDLRSDHPALPGALESAVALWTVRLVGDLPWRDDDPPAIAALSLFDSGTVARFFRMTGLAKWSISSRALPESDKDDQGQLDPLRALLAEIDPRFVSIATREVGAIGAGETHPVVRIGMTSFARLLQGADPYRVRWALQHLPYPTAKALRGLMGTAGRSSPLLVRCETEVLRAAWTRLHQAGRVSDPWGWAT